MISSSRTSENGTITIDQEKCNACGFCAVVCKSFCLAVKDNKLQIVDDSPFGCIGCSQCVVVCPRNAIMVTGRTISSDDYKPLNRSQVHPDELYKLMLNRRSVRDYHNQPVPSEIIDKILEMSSTAPMGIPPSNVEVLVLNGKEKVREFSFDYISVIEKKQFLFNPFFFSLMKPFMSKADYVAMNEFVLPLFKLLISSRKQDINYVLYDAPLAMVFYGRQTSDPADATIAATYAMLAAESFGLGTCMIGMVGPVLKYGDKNLNKKYNIPLKIRDSITVIMGYPKYKFRKTVKRTFAEVKHI